MGDKDLDLSLFNNLDWSILNNWPTEKEYIESEVRYGVYTKFLDVEPGDIVFDIGSSIGPFTASILHKQPKEIHCFEPHKELHNSLCNNLKSISNVYINNVAISSNTNQVLDPQDFFPLDNHSVKKQVNTIKFSDYISSKNIEKIDFLKTDCEGAEWDIFTQENFNWISKNVRKIAGEFHLYNLDTKIKFIRFRDLYLINAGNVKVYISNKYANVDLITDRIWDNDFVYANLNYCNISFEFGNTYSKNPKPTVWVVDNFYDDPNKIRNFALAQEYIEGGLGRGFIGRRTEKQFLFLGLKERFEEIMGRTIVAWESHGMNGRFQIAWSGEPLVYHCDSQRWAGMLYLTPNAPYACGTSLLAHKVTRARSYYDSGWDAAWTNVPGDSHLDGTSFESVDVLGNVFNRLVIFDASCIHSASQYFGTVRENSRLWQMFFFD